QKQTAKLLEISESSVKRYSSDNQEKDNEFDEKTGKLLTKQFDLEGYDFQDEIAPLVYKLKNQANEINITLYDYLNDISSNMSKFLRLTENPERFYYIFCELSKNLSVITEHIEAEKLIEAIDNFYNREIEMEEAENFIAEIEEKAELLLENVKEEYNEYKKKINNVQNELKTIISTEGLMMQKILQKPDKEKLQNAEIKINNLAVKLQIIAENALMIENKNKDLKSENQNLKKMLNQIKQENLALDMVFDKIKLIFPEEIKSIVAEVSSESQKL
ncbi:hypothetical protein LCGC14_1763550, partial [marine sediment metagenome]